MKTDLDKWRGLWGMGIAFYIAAWALSFFTAAMRSEMMNRPEYAGTTWGSILIWTPVVDHLVLITVFWLLLIGIRLKNTGEYLPLSTDEFRRQVQALRHPIAQFIFAVVCGVAVYGVSHLLSWLGGPGDDEFWKKLVACRLCLWAYMAEVVLVAPLVEEAVYRGLLFHALERRFGKWLVVLITALAFLGIHLIQSQGRITAILAFLTFGLVAGWLRAWTGSVWPGWVAHFTANLIVAAQFLTY